MKGGGDLKAAFTLMELMVVIGIVAVLSGIAVPIFSMVAKNGDRTAAVSQMRQIAAGLAAYPSDHQGTMPGPLYPGQMPMLDTTRAGRLVVILAPYLDITVPSTPQLIPLFIPPAYKKAVSASFLTDARTYVTNMAVPLSSLPGAAVINPWGNAASGGTEPVPVAQVPMTAWAICDADQLNPRVIGTPWQANTPPTVIHGAERLAIRFDGSVAPIDASELVIPP